MRTMRAGRSGVAAAVVGGASLMACAAGCWHFCSSGLTGYDVNARVTGPDAEPLREVPVELWVYHEGGDIEHDWTFTDPSGRVNEFIRTGVWADCGPLWPTRSDDRSVPRATYVTLKLTGQRWHRTVSVAVADDQVMRDDDDVIESIDLGDVAADPQAAHECAEVRAPPLTLLTTPTVEDLVGTYHARNTLAAANIIIRDDGTFTWDWCRCDAATVVSGSVVVEEDATYLSGPEDSLRFLLFNYEEELRVSEGEFDRVAIQVTDDGFLRTLADDAAFLTGPLEWLPGRVCPVCVEEAGAVALEECCCFTCPAADPIDGVDECEPD